MIVGRGLDTYHTICMHHSSGSAKHLDKQTHQDDTPNTHLAVQDLWTAVMSTISAGHQMPRWLHVA
jgi:hypothetical protein